MLTQFRTCVKLYNFESVHPDSKGAVYANASYQNAIILSNDI